MMIALKSRRHLTHFSLFSTDSARIFKRNQFLVVIEFNMQTFPSCNTVCRRKTRPIIFQFFAKVKRKTIDAFDMALKFEKFSMKSFENEEC